MLEKFAWPGAGGREIAVSLGDWSFERLIIGKLSAKRGNRGYDFSDC